MGKQDARGPGRAILLLFLFAFLFSAASSESAEVVIVGDTALRPVNDIIKLVKGALPARAAVYSPQQVRGRLDSVIRREKAKVVVALGSDSLSRCLNLPEKVPLVYGLVIKRVSTQRKNISGIYMATPVNEYLSFIRRFFPSLKKIGAICSSGDDIIDDDASDRLILYRADDSYGFVKGVSALERKVDAILLLPERDLLTSTSVEELFRSSYTVQKPVIGLSEKFVKRGALFALVFNETAMGRQVADMVNRVLRDGSASGITPSPPLNFDLYLNAETARMMKIPLPPELLGKAERVYP